MIVEKRLLMWDLADVYSYLMDQAEFYPHDPDYARFAETVLRAMRIIEQHEAENINVVE